jgi:hypothetical protein
MRIGKTKISALTIVLFLVLLMFVYSTYMTKQIVNVLSDGVDDLSALAKENSSDEIQKARNEALLAVHFQYQITKSHYTRNTVTSLVFFWLILISSRIDNIKKTRFSNE